MADPAPRGISGWRLGACNGPGTATFKRLVGGATCAVHHSRRGCLAPEKLPPDRPSARPTAEEQGSARVTRGGPLGAPRDRCKLIAEAAHIAVVPESDGGRRVIGRIRATRPRVPRKSRPHGAELGGTEAPNRTHELCMKIA